MPSPSILHLTETEAVQEPNLIEVDANLLKRCESLITVLTGALRYRGVSQAGTSAKEVLSELRRIIPSQIATESRTEAEEAYPAPLHQNEETAFNGAPEKEAEA